MHVWNPNVQESSASFVNGKQPIIMQSSMTTSNIGLNSFTSAHSITLLEHKTSKVYHERCIKQEQNNIHYFVLK